MIVLAHSVLKMRLALTLILLALCADLSFAQGMMNRGRGMMASREAPNDPEFTAKQTGLFPVFPPGYTCPDISSPYGSATRYDGSSRPYEINHGTHGGLDITIEDRTPLLALADAEIIATGQGGQMEGNFVWLRISPESSAQPFWSFIKYQHLATPSALAIGTKVKAGSVVAYGSNSGTTGGHYGVLGYHHLHISAYYAETGEFEVIGQFKSRVRPKNGHAGDPMLIFDQGLSGLSAALALSAEKRGVPVGIVTQGNLIPLNAKTLWPIACEPTQKD